MIAVGGREVWGTLVDSASVFNHAVKCSACLLTDPASRKRGRYLAATLRRANA